MSASTNAGTRRLLWVSALAGATGGVAVVFLANARPGALFFRSVLKRSPRLTRPQPTRFGEDVASIADEHYEPSHPDARLDVYYPSRTTAGARLPTIVWVHGGAWISGAKDVDAHYFETLARDGFAVISVEYSQAPDARYPTPIVQINDALAFVQLHAERFHVDDQQVILAGDSAGAQIMSQIATIATSPAYAHEVGIVPSVRPEQLRGAILFCGVYDAASAARHPNTLSNAVFQLFSRSVMWAYTGDRERDSANRRQMSTIDHVTGDFPPTFISGGNADPFTDAHSRPFAARLRELGVDVTALFFPTDHPTASGHQYQFRLDSADGQTALRAVLDFLRARTHAGAEADA